MVIPKLDRLTRSVPDARAIADELERHGVRLQLGASVYNPRDPMGRGFFTCSLRSPNSRHFCPACARASQWQSRALEVGRKGRPPKLSASQQQHPPKLSDADEKTVPELADLFSVSRATVYRLLDRHDKRAPREPSASG